jgi:urease accessory protein UreF
MAGQKSWPPVWNEMVNQQQLALNDAAEWLGDFHPLAEQLGSSSLLALSSLSDYLRLPEVDSVASLQKFLGQYKTNILSGFELPAIQAGHYHSERNQLRELIRLDRGLADEPLLELFSSASRRVGHAQLKRLRPLRDQRIVQRYLRAVDCGAASGWHTLVYGLTLAVYSLPLRQGLLGYAHQATRGYIYMAASNLRISEHECRAIFDETSGDFQPMVEKLLCEPFPARE